MGINVHQDLINKNHELWNSKPLLRPIYQDFYRLVSSQLSGLKDPKIVELGSGMGHIREVIPNCICTELFPYPWIDQIENAYRLSFENESVSDLILTDVFHHLKYPGTALNEFHRVVRKGGRVIMLEPCTSALGLLVYGKFHVEPIAVKNKIEWFAPREWTPDSMDYYAAQGNATRIFVGNRRHYDLTLWKQVRTIRKSALAYVASGGYSGPQLYPLGMYPMIKSLEKILNLFPALFATRLLVILEK